MDTVFYKLPFEQEHLDDQYTFSCMDAVLSSEQQVPFDWNFNSSYQLGFFFFFCKKRFIFIVRVIKVFIYNLTKNGPLGTHIQCRSSKN